MKVSTEKCGLCEKPHAGYTIKHDKQQRRYVICEQTNKKMYVQVANTPGDSFVSMGPSLGVTVWTAESACPKCLGRHTCSCECHFGTDGRVMHTIACCGPCPDCGRPCLPSLRDMAAPIAIPNPPPAEIVTVRPMTDAEKKGVCGCCGVPTGSSHDPECHWSES